MRLDGSQIMQYWISAGGPVGWAALLAGFALSESGGYTTAVEPLSVARNPAGVPTPRYQGWGLWQITPGDASMLTPKVNAQNAVGKFRAQGTTAWFGDRTWRAWRAAGAPPMPSAVVVARYVAAWGGTFGPVSATHAATPGGGPGTPPPAPSDVETAWVHLQGYAHDAFPVQMRQWDGLTRQVDKI